MSSGISSKAPLPSPKEKEPPLSIQTQQDPPSSNIDDSSSKKITKSYKLPNGKSIKVVITKKLTDQEKPSSSPNKSGKSLKSMLSFRTNTSDKSSLNDKSRSPYSQKPTPKSNASSKYKSSKVAVDDSNGGGEEVSEFDESNGDRTSSNMYRKDVHRPSVIYQTRLKKLEEENLEEDFERTAWLPPSIEKAYLYQQKHIFREGNTRIDSINVVHAPDLPVGVNLYFQFALTMTYCLFIMSLLSIPSLVFVYNGQGIGIENQDTLGLYRYTLGNIGYNQNNVNYAKLSSCHTSRYKTAANETCIHFNGYELSLSDTSYILSAFEILQIIIFLFGILHLYYSVEKRSAKTTSHHSISVTDYAVMVTHLPSEIDETDLIRHFSQLYQLQKRDWKGRPAVIGAKPVKSVGNTGLDYYQSTWIAECILHKNIGKFISSFRNKQHLTKSLYRSRALMKMYKQDTPHANGANPVLYKRAEHDMLRIAHDIDVLTRHNILHSGLKVIVDSPDVEQGGGANTLVEHKTKNPHSIYYNIDADSSTAFIIFQYNESMARCINDYSYYTSFPFSLFYPAQLRIRGHEIMVTKAPEPDQIIWENLDVPVATKFYLRLRTAGITFLLILIAFIVILQASIYKESFETSKPDLSLCENSIPQLYVNASSSISYNSISLIRKKDSNNNEDEDYHAKCALITNNQNAFYARYVYGNNFSNPIAYYNFTTCQTSLCPVLGAPSFCPCITTTSTTQCKTAQCSYDTNHFPPNKVKGKCKTFTAGTIGACYCYNQILTFLKTGNTGNILAEECFHFYYDYIIATGLTYGSIIITVLVNVLTRISLKLLAKSEAYNSLDVLQASIVTKIFITNYLTMGILVLVAYGNIEGLQKISFFKTFHLFIGSYTDFTSDWYGNLGMYLMSTFIIQSFSPLIVNIIRYYIIKPLFRWYHFRKVEAKRSHTIVMQDDLNQLMVGNVFDSTDHAAQLLTLLFFAMMYAPGFPLLMPLCCIAFISYFRIDKFLLCRYYQKPLNIGDAVIRQVIFYLPFAAIIRLGFAIWMFTAPNILGVKYNNQYTTLLAKIAKDEQSSALADNSSINERLYAPHVFLLFVLIIIIAISIVLKLFWRQLPFYWILRLFNKLYIRCCGSTKKQLYAEETMTYSRNKRAEDVFDDDDDNNPASHRRGIISMWDLIRSGDELRKHSAPYTDHYFKLIKHKDFIPKTCYDMILYGSLEKLTELEVEEGFKVQSLDDYIVHVKLWQRVMKKIDGKRCKVGEKKKTYEVISDHRYYSYDIEKIEEYRFTLRGLREGIIAFIEFLKRNDITMEHFLTLIHSTQQQSSSTEEAQIEKKELLNKLANSGLSSHIVEEYMKQKQLLNDQKRRNKNGRKMSVIDHVMDNMEKSIEKHTFLKSILPNIILRMINRWNARIFAESDGGLDLTSGANSGIEGSNRNAEEGNDNNSSSDSEGGEDAGKVMEGNNNEEVVENQLAASSEDVRDDSKDIEQGNEHPESNVEPHEQVEERHLNEKANGEANHPHPQHPETARDETKHEHYPSHNNDPSHDNPSPLHQKSSKKDKSSRKHRKKHNRKHHPDSWDSYDNNQLEHPSYHSNYSNTDSLPLQQLSTRHPPPFNPSEPSYYDPNLGGFVRPPSRPGEPVIVAVPINPQSMSQAIVPYNNISSSTANWQELPLNNFDNHHHSVRFESKSYVDDYDPLPLTSFGKFTDPAHEEYYRKLGFTAPNALLPEEDDALLPSMEERPMTSNYYEDPYNESQFNYYDGDEPSLSSMDYMHPHTSSYQPFNQNYDHFQPFQPMTTSQGSWASSYVLNNPHTDQFVDTRPSSKSTSKRNKSDRKPASAPSSKRKSQKNHKNSNSSGKVVKDGIVFHPNL